MIALERLKDILHRKDYTVRDRLLLVLSTGESIAKSAAQVKQIALAAGLRSAAKWDLYDILKAGKGEVFAIRTSKGWELTAAGLEYISSNLLVKKQTKSQSTPNSPLNSNSSRHEQEQGRADQQIKNNYQNHPSILKSIPSINTRQLRNLIKEVMRTDSEFEAFCLDFYRGVKKRFSSSMDLEIRINLLLEIADNIEIFKNLFAEYPERVKSFLEAMET